MHHYVKGDEAGTGRRGGGAKGPGRRQGRGGGGGRRQGRVCMLLIVGLLGCAQRETARGHRVKRKR